VIPLTHGKPLRQTAFKTIKALSIIFPVLNEIAIFSPIERLSFKIREGGISMEKLGPYTPE